MEPKAYKRQYLIVMRHGLRLDEVDMNWTQTTERPWDPPLAQQGLEEVREAGKLLRSYGIKKIVVSPFLRCLQTASVICRTLQPPICTVEVDNSLSEVLGPTYFAGTGGPSEGQTVEDWLWHGASPETAWKQGLNSDQITAISADRSFPVVPESLSEAHARYAEAIEVAANRADGQNLLVVTHGEAVGKSVTRLLPWVSVYLVNHCGFTVAWRELDAEGDWDPWQLDLMDGGPSKGVAWRSRNS